MSSTTSVSRKVNIVVPWLYYRPQESQNRRIEALLVHLHTNHYETVNSEFTDPPLFNNPPHLLPIAAARLTEQGEVHLQRRPDKSSRKLPISQLLSLFGWLNPTCDPQNGFFRKVGIRGPLHDLLYSHAFVPRPSILSAQLYL